jgi:hypothetical protein
MMDQTFSDGILIESMDDHNDGTATLTDHTTNPPTVTQLTGLPIYEPAVEPSTPQVVAAQAISDEITIRLDPAGTIPEIKAAITDGLAAAIITLGG